MKHSPVPLFVTLTYRESTLPIGDDNNITQSILVKSDVQKFLKRLRKNGSLGKFRYFAVGEYGAKFNRAHYHLVIMPREYHRVSEATKVIENAWSTIDQDGKRQPIGFVKVKYCTEKHVHYVCKYMNKLDGRKHLVKPFRLYSHGLGLCYLSAEMINYYMSAFKPTCLNGSFEISLPRYFRRKLDEVAKSHPKYCELHLSYNEICDLVRPYSPEPGTKYSWFREFQQRLQKMDDLQYELFEKYNMPLFLPSLNHYFNAMCNGVPELVNLKAVSDRHIEECKIRNHLTRHYSGVTLGSGVDVLILKE